MFVIIQNWKILKNIKSITKRNHLKATNENKILIWRMFILNEIIK